VPAQNFQDKEIPFRASAIDAQMLKALRCVQEAGTLLNDPVIAQTEADALKRLADDGWVDPAYSGTAGSAPFGWTMNHNGERALRYFDSATIHDDDAPPVDPFLD
jgi:hypothetical protein